MDDIIVNYEADDGVGILTLNRPHRMNALTIGGYRAAGRAVRQLNADGASVIVVRSSSANFCSGGDLGVIDGAATENQLVETMANFNDAAFELFSALDDSKATVVTAVRGHCLAGGLIISLLSDIVLADPTARFGVPESRVGVGDPFVPARLPQRVGDLRAREMILGGRIIDAETALHWGLVTSVASPERLERDVELVLEQVLRLSAYSRGFYREHLRKHAAPLAAAPNASTDPETVEGVSAFMARREPNWVRRRDEGWFIAALDRIRVGA